MHLVVQMIAFCVSVVKGQSAACSTLQQTLLVSGIIWAENHHSIEALYIKRMSLLTQVPPVLEGLKGEGIDTSDPSTFARFFFSSSDVTGANVTCRVADGGEKILRSIH